MHAREPGEVPSLLPSMWMPDPSTLRLDLLKVNPVVSARLSFVVVGECVEARCFRSFIRQNVVRHADNRRRVQSAAQFGEDGRVRTQPALNGLPEDVAEVLFIFRVGLVADATTWG